MRRERSTGDQPTLLLLPQIAHLPSGPQLSLSPSKTPLAYLKNHNCAENLRGGRKASTESEVSLVAFAGRRWIVQDIDEKTNTLFVVPHPSGVVPRFERADGERLHDQLAA